ncbi:hypothetical protein [Paenibacillus sp. MMO-58]|uniref:hypothetical protein n=1 Tax=Paenibacillus sp. MMO-58 TaxID=3081290 RepID=UPI003016B7B5
MSKANASFSMNICLLRFRSLGFPHKKPIKIQKQEWQIGLPLKLAALFASACLKASRIVLH